MVTDGILKIKKMISEQQFDQYSTDFAKFWQMYSWESMLPLACIVHRALMHCVAERNR